MMHCKHHLKSQMTVIHELIGVHDVHLPAAFLLLSYSTAADLACFGEEDNA